MAGVFELVIFRSSFQVKLFYGAVVRTVIFPPMGLVHITSTQTVEYEQTWLGGEAALLCSSHCADSQLYGMTCFTVVEVSRISSMLDQGLGDKFPSFSSSDTDTTSLNFSNPLSILCLKEESTTKLQQGADEEIQFNRQL